MLPSARVTDSPFKPTSNFISAYVAEEKKNLENKNREDLAMQKLPPPVEDPIYSPYLPTASEVKRNSALALSDHLFLEATHTIQESSVTLVIANIYDPRLAFGFAPEKPLPIKERAKNIIHILKEIKNRNKNLGVIMIQEEFLYSHQTETGINLVQELQSIGLNAIFALSSGLLTIYNPRLFSVYPSSHPLAPSLEVAGENNGWGGAMHKWLRLPLKHKTSGKTIIYCNIHASFTPFPFQKSEMVREALKKEKEFKKIMAGDFNSHIYTRGQPKVTQISQPVFRGYKGYGAASTDGGFLYEPDNDKISPLIFKPIDYLEYLGLSLERKEVKTPETPFHKAEMQPRMYMHVADVDTQWQPLEDSPLTLTAYQQALRKVTEDKQLIIERTMGMREDDTHRMIIMPSRAFFSLYTPLLSHPAFEKIALSTPNDLEGESIFALTFSPKDLPTFNDFIQKATHPIFEKYSAFSLMQKWRQQLSDKHFNLKVEDKHIILNLSTQVYSLLQDKVVIVKARQDDALRWEVSIPFSEIPKLQAIIQQFSKPLRTGSPSYTIFDYVKELSETIEDKALAVVNMDVTHNQCILNVTERVTPYLKATFTEISEAKSKGLPKDRKLIRIPFNKLIPIQDALKMIYHKPILGNKNVMQYRQQLQHTLSDEKIRTKLILDENNIQAVEFSVSKEIGLYISKQLPEIIFISYLDRIRFNIEREKLAKLDAILKEAYCHPLSATDTHSFHFYITHGRTIERRLMVYGQPSSLGFRLKLPSDIAQYILDTKKFKKVEQLSLDADTVMTDIFVPLAEYKNMNEDLLTHYKDIPFSGKSIHEHRLHLKKILNYPAANLYPFFSSQGWECIVEINNRSYGMLQNRLAVYLKTLTKDHCQLQVPFEKVESVLTLLSKTFDRQLFDELSLSTYQSLLKDIPPSMQLFYSQATEEKKIEVGVKFEKISLDKMEKIKNIYNRQDANIIFLTTNENANVFNLYFPLEKLLIMDACLHQAYLPIPYQGKKKASPPPQSWFKSVLQRDHPNDHKAPILEKYNYPLAPPIFMHYAIALKSECKNSNNSIPNPRLFTLNAYVKSVTPFYPQLPILHALLLLELELPHLQYSAEDRQKIYEKAPSSSAFLINPVAFFNILYQYQKLQMLTVELLNKPMDAFLRNAILADILQMGKTLKKIYFSVSWDLQFKLYFSKFKEKAPSIPDVHADYKGAEATFAVFDLLSGNTPLAKNPSVLEVAAFQLSQTAHTTGIFYYPSMVTSLDFSLEAKKDSPPKSLALTR